MTKRILPFVVNGQKLQKKDQKRFQNVVRGTSNYIQCSFDLSSDWSGCNVAASFFANDSEYPVLVKNGLCDVPTEVLSKERFYLRLTGMNGDYKIVSNKVSIRTVI